MKTFLYPRLLLAGWLIVFAGMGNVLDAQATDVPPRLTLEGANGENHCTLDFKSGTYDFKGNTYCNNDKAVGLLLENVPSASNLLLFDDYSCDRNDDGNYFWIYLRTIKEGITYPPKDDPTARPIDLEQIMTMPKGAIIAPGVRVMDYYQMPGETPKERTSCVQIEIDAPELPPLK